MAASAVEDPTSLAVRPAEAGAPSLADINKTLPGPSRLRDRGTQTDNLPAPCALVGCRCGRKPPSAAHNSSSPPTKRHPSIGPPRPARQDSSPPVKGEDDVEDQSLLANIPEALRARADHASPPDQKMQKVIFKWGDRRVVNWRPHPRPLGPSPEPSPAPSPHRPPTPNQKMQKVIFKWGDRRVVNWVCRRPVATTEEEGPPPPPSPSPRRSPSPSPFVPASPPSSSPTSPPSPPSPPSSPFVPPPLWASVTPPPRPVAPPRDLRWAWAQDGRF